MKRSLEDRRSRVESITSAVLATNAKQARWCHDFGAEAMLVAEPYERLRLVNETSQLKARRRSCVAGIHCS